MASLFDPTAFVEAEKRSTIATVAVDRVARDSVPDTAEPAENRHSGAVLTPTIATIATIAAPKAETHDWPDAVALLTALRKPMGLDETRWKHLVRLVKWTAEDWQEPARLAGWHPLEFYGCNPEPFPFCRRWDRDGLVMLLFRSLSPLQVTAVYPDHVEIRTRDAISRYRAFGPRGQVFLWEAYSLKGGP